MTDYQTFVKCYTPSSEESRARQQRMMNDQRLARYYEKKYLANPGDFDNLLRLSRYYARRSKIK
jgi:hypothetical protein